MFDKIIEKYHQMLKTLKESRDYSCAMAYLDDGDLNEDLSDTYKAIAEFVRSIPEEELYVAEEGHGRELEPHVTILYGLHSNNPDEIYENLDLKDDIKGTLGKLSFFENDKYNVLKLDIDSEDLTKLNKKLTDSMEFTSDFPDYHAHMTIAYLNKEADTSKYDGKEVFEGVDVTFPFVKISGPEANKFFKITD